MRLTSKYIKIVLGIVLAAVVVISAHDFFIYPQNVRRDCNSLALRWVSEKANVQNPTEYMNAAIADGYRFKYETCIHEKGF